MKILVAEDQPIPAAILRRLLERLGHRVTVAPDGDAAWRLASEEVFPVVITDWLMPGLDGPALCRKIREQVGRPYTYLILLTCKQGRDERLEGLRAGADDFLTKPPDPDELTVRLEIARRILSIQEALEWRNAQLAEQASSDGLTGLKNRRKFHEIVEKHASTNDRRDAVLSLLMIDVDQFKSYNDEFGHPAGDSALRVVAASLQEGVREVDAVGRVGGEEFAVLLPDTPVEVARELANRLRLLIASKPWPLRPLTISVGVTTALKPCVIPSDLFQQADLALYHSKHRGRNRVTHFRDLSEAIREGSPTATDDDPG